MIDPGDPPDRPGPCAVKADAAPRMRPGPDLSRNDTMTYHFHVYNGTQVVPDREGSRLGDPQALRDEVRTIARELLQDGFRAGQDRLRWRLSVVDAAGATVADYTLPRAAL